MAETRYCDCPECHRANVVGYKKEAKESKYWKGGATGYGAIVGGLLGGPLGAAVGAGLGKVAGDMLADETEGNWIDFQFQCPACNHRWEKSFKK